MATEVAASTQRRQTRNEKREMREERKEKGKVRGGKWEKGDGR